MTLFLANRKNKNLKKLLRNDSCSHCNQTGYKGRIGVYEFLETNEEMASALRNNDTHAFAQAVKNHKGFIPLKKSITTLVIEGKTSLDEAIRVAGEL